MTVTIHRTHPSAHVPATETYGSFGHDLALVEDATLHLNQTRICDLGFQLAQDLPLSPGVGTAMLILPRSSLINKWGLEIPNSPGLVDADYAGPMGVLLRYVGIYDEYGQLVKQTAMCETDRITIPAGTRVAQAVFIECLLPHIVEGVPDTARVRGGFGSTGTDAKLSYLPGGAL